VSEYGDLDRIALARDGNHGRLKIELVVRGKSVPAEIVPMPFVKHAYYRG